MQEAVAAVFPDGTPRRKLLQIISIILIFEGLSVIILFSKIGFPFGIVSFIVGVTLLLLIFPRIQEVPVAKEEETPGIRLVNSLVRMVGGSYVVMAAGALVIVLVIVYNELVSARAELGDLDTLSMLFGGMLLIYPFISGKFKVEACFSIIFLALVVIILVIPQAVTSASGDNGESSIGSWYVHYMLAAPFAMTLDTLGIDASSSGNFVTLQFQDGSVHTLGISAYCAGLYSFSIFLAAFFSFVLVFERLPRRTLALVLAIGLVVAYLGNLFRMVVIGVVGYYRGVQALLWAHENVGWVIFLSWSAIFWYVLLGYVSRRSSGKSSPG